MTVCKCCGGSGVEQADTRRIKFVHMTYDILRLIKDPDYEKEMENQRVLFAQPWFREQYKDFIIFEDEVVP